MKKAEVEASGRWKCRLAGLSVLAVLILGSLLYWLESGSRPAEAAPEDKKVCERWTEEKAWEWKEKAGWLVGSNYVPSYAVNQIEMFQDETWDPERVRFELCTAQKKAGMTVMRVFLHNLLWEAGPDRYLARLEEYLTISDGCGLKTIFVIFDACWRAVARLGKQPEPLPHTHNPGWVQCPTHNVLRSRTQWHRLESYVKAVVKRFKNDPRVVLWDVYNEPSNTDMEYAMLPKRLSVEEGAANATFPRLDKLDAVYHLLEKSFRWVREECPSQPVTSAVWGSQMPPSSYPAGEKSWQARFANLQIRNSDVLSFHNYEDAAGFKQYVSRFAGLGRPMVCSEFVARGYGSTIIDIAPLLHKGGIGAIMWGLFDGKTQTVYPWDSWHTPYSEKPAIWHHDLFDSEGSPFSAAEVSLLQLLSSSARTQPQTASELNGYLSRL